MSSIDFATVTLTDACQLITDGSHFSPTPREDGYPIVNAKDIPKGRVELATCTRISESEWMLLKKQNCSPAPGDVLLSKDGTIGRVVHYKEDLEVVLLSSVAILRSKEFLNPAFLAHVLRSHVFDQQLFRLQSGSALKRLVLGDIRKIRIPVPDLDVQHSVAEILSTLDEAIEQTEALIAKHQQVKAGLMHDLFTRGITPDGHLRPTREQAPELYKESSLGWIPKEWDTATLSERGRSGRPHLKTGPFGSSLKIEHWVGEGHPVITIGALGEGEFIHSELLFVSNATAQRLREYQLEVGDVVFSRVADVGRSAAILEQHKGWIMSSNLMRISLDQAKVRAAYLQAQLAHDSRVRAQIRATVNAGGRDVANSQILNRLLFAWPQPEEQTRILDRVEALDGKRQAETSHLDNLIKQKPGLMHDLLTGRVRVPVAEAKEGASNG